MEVSALAGDARFAATAHADELLDDRARVLRQAGRRQRRLKSPGLP
jgi:hypothetical protein